MVALCVEVLNSLGVGCFVKRILGKDGLVVNSTGPFSRRPRFDLEYQLGGSQLAVTSLRI